MAGIQVDATETPEAMVVRVAGDADADNVDELDRQLRSLVAVRPSCMILDVSGLSFISSMGIGVLLRIRNELAENTGRLLVAAPRPMVRESLRRAGLLEVLRTFDTVDQAKADGSGG